jgi:mRNA interferase MazF
VDRLNHGPAGLVIVVPITSKDRGIALHVPIDPPAGGLTARSFAKPEDVRSVSVERLMRKTGSVPAALLDEVRDRLRILLDL